MGLVHLNASLFCMYGHFSSLSSGLLQSRMPICIDDVACWMSANRLQINASKTELLWCTSARRQHQLLRTPFRVCRDSVSPTTSVRDLDIFSDSDVSMDAHISSIVSGCFHVLRKLKSSRRSLSDSVFQSLIAALVLKKLDYGNATLAGIPAYQSRRLQAVERCCSSGVPHQSP